MKFSQRIGKTEIKVSLDKEQLSQELRNTLWTLIFESIIEAKLKEKFKSYHEKYSEITKFYRNLWINFFKNPIDTMPTAYNDKDQVIDSMTTKTLRDWYFKANWYQVFDFIEFCSNETNDNNFKNRCNTILKQEFSAYRFVNGNLVEINSKEEIIEIERAINISDQFKPVKTHLQRALELISDKRNPDYRNSIKESISAVESICKIILNNDKTTLGKALSEIEKKHKIPGSLKSAFSSLYGFTSDDAGIRHGLLESDIKVEIEDARFMLITCSAFINYLL